MGIRYANGRPCTHKDLLAKMTRHKLEQTEGLGIKKDQNNTFEIRTRNHKVRGTPRYAEKGYLG